MGYESIHLDQLRQETSHLPIRQPFQHQNEAFKALTHTFLRPDRQKPGSGILVLPTGAVVLGFTIPKIVAALLGPTVIPITVNLTSVFGF